MTAMLGQVDMFDLLEPEPSTIDFSALTGFTINESDPDKLDAIAKAWTEAYGGLPHGEWRMFPGWRESQTGRSAMGTPHPTFVYNADLRCHHWKEVTWGGYDGYCQCVGKELYYRAYCAGCDWWTPVAEDENGAAELILDHCWPGWRDLPTVESKMNAKYGYDFALPSDYPTEWKVPGAPVKECRGMTQHGTRHVPSGSPWGGYRTAVVRECKQHKTT